MSHQNPSQAPVFVGIDLGSTQCAAAFVSDEQQATMIPLAPKGVLPSVLYFPRQLTQEKQASEITWNIKDLLPVSVVGEEALAYLQDDPTRGCCYIKQRLHQPSWFLDIDDWQLDAETLTCLLLLHIKERLLPQLPGPLAGVVISIPAQFSDQARRSTLQAAKLAGLPVLGLLHEPTAAALAHGYAYSVPTLLTPEPQQVLTEKLLVFDLGGGTLDISCVETTPESMQVRATVGDPNLGGQDFDNAILEDMSPRMELALGIDPLLHPFAFVSLQQAVIQTRESLSSRSPTTLSWQYNDWKWSEEWSHDKLNNVSAPLLARCKSLTHHALLTAGWEPASDFDIILAGGASRMPIVHGFLEAEFEKELRHHLDPGSAIAVGAAQFAYQNRNQRGLSDADLFLPGRKVEERMPHPLGFLIQSEGKLHYQPIFPRNSPLPVETKAAGFTTSYDKQTVLDLLLSQDPGQDHLDLEGLVAGCRLKGIPPLPAQTPEIHLTVRYSLEGLIEIEGWEETTQTSLETEWLLPEDLFARWKRTQTLHLVLLIDTSKSMQGRPLVEAKYAVHSFLQSLLLSPLDQHTISLISFGFEGVKVLAELQKDVLVLQGIVGQLSAGGKTPLRQALQKAGEIVSQAAPSDEKQLLVLSDGKPNDPEMAALAAGTLKSSGTIIRAVGLGPEVDADFLAKQVCSTPDDYFGVEDPFALPYTFQTLATMMFPSMKRES